jgi:hypothetical protein
MTLGTMTSKNSLKSYDDLFRELGRKSVAFNGLELVLGPKKSFKISKLLVKQQRTTE